MENCGASSQGLDICTQEKSIITPTNGGGGGGGATSKQKWRKRKENKSEKDDAHGTKQCFFNGVHQ